MLLVVFCHCGGEDGRDARPRTGKDVPPNIVFILVDDLGWMDVGCQGNDFFETPHIDGLAEDGMRFTDAYASSPVCSPTRASILTGQYPARIGITDWIPGDFPDLWPPTKRELPLEEVTLAEVLSDRGYATASIGKWHLGEEPYYPEKHGFDINVGGTDRGRPDTYFSPYGIATLPEGEEGEYLTDRLAAEAVTFIETNRNRPFFLYWSHFAVHTPIQAPEDLVEKYRGKPQSPGGGYRLPSYAAMVDRVDRAVSRLLDTLDELGLAGNTLVVFTSDNGGLAWVTRNEPLRGGKATAYEGGVRVPMIVRWPGTVEPGTVCTAPVTSVDFFPTFLEIAGARGESPRNIDGLSLLPLLNGQAALAREALYWHYPHFHINSMRPYSSIRVGDYKLIEFLKSGNLELYNLAEDIRESTNLSGEMPEESQRLLRMLQAWRDDVGALLP